MRIVKKYNEKQVGVLSTGNNMSIGFTPILMTVILCNLLSETASVAIGVGIGLIYALFLYKKRDQLPPNFILFASTAILVLLLMGLLSLGEIITYRALPMTLEVSVLIVSLALTLHKRRFINQYLKVKELKGQKLFIYGAESTFVAVNIYSLLCLGHLLIIALCLLLFKPISESLFVFLFLFGPPFLFFITIVLNQLSIRFFNRMPNHKDYFPVVNPKGKVIGKSLSQNAFYHKDSQIFPVVRIAIMSNGQLYLSRRASFLSLDPDKIDLPLETYLRYQETLNDACKRLLKRHFESWRKLELNFSITYRFENSVTNRLIYLYLLEIDNEATLKKARFKDAKLWHIQQIEQNLDCNFFSECFENEFDYLKDVIDIREKYKEF